MKFADDQLHFDVLVVNKASHFPEHEARLLFSMSGSNGCLTVVRVMKLDDHPVIISNAAFAMKKELHMFHLSRLTPPGPSPFRSSSLTFD